MPEFVTSLPLLGVTACLAYLLGSVPFGIVSARLFGLGDLRQVGSGNIGATNVLRTGNRYAAFFTLVFDAGKGAAAVLIARLLLAEDAAQVAGLFAFVGHLLPIYLRFKGGKGVATLLGIVLALAFPVGIAACLTWAVVAALFRYSSLAALISAAFIPIWAIILGHGSLFLLTALLAQIIFLRHRENVQRLVAREEPKIGDK